MKFADADISRVAAENEIKSLEDLNVYSQVPLSIIPPAKEVISTKWVFKIKPNNAYKARLVVQFKDGTKYRDRTAAAHSLQFVDYRLFEW